MKEIDQLLRAAAAGNINARRCLVAVLEDQTTEVSETSLLPINQVLAIYEGRASWNDKRAAI